MRFTIHSKTASAAFKMIIAFTGEEDCDLLSVPLTLTAPQHFPKKQPYNAFWGIRVALFKAFPYAFPRKGNCNPRFGKLRLLFWQETRMSFKRKATLIGSFGKCGCLFAETQVVSPKKGNRKN